MDFPSKGNAPTKRRTKQNAKIDVKEMRKKFEVVSIENGEEKRLSKGSQHSQESLQQPVEKKTLKLTALDSNDDRRSVNCSLYTSSSHPDIPKAPARRNRNKQLNVQKTRAVYSNNMDHPPKSDKAENLLSVRERSKLFESNSNINFNDQVNFQPPAKPPRTPNKSTDLNTQGDSNSGISETVKDETLKKIMELNTNIAKKVKRDISPCSKKPAYNSLSLSDNAGINMPIRLTPRLLSAPEIHVEGLKSSDVPSSKGPKISVYNNKTKVFNYCLTNLSNMAQNLRGKVMNKPQSDFMNSAAATVPQQRKIRTLRKSFSDDHIYAEPFEVEAVKSQRSHASCEVDALHYMCTPLIDRDFGDDRFLKPSATENQTVSTHLGNDSKPSKVALRKIIYESFSMLRRTPETENNPRTDDNANGDSESDVSAKDVAERITYVKSMRKQASTSSICISPKLFDAVLILCVSENGPQVLYKQSKATPFDYPLIHHLCFPDYKTLHKAEVYKSEWFQFTLVHGDDEKIFGYCHRILGWSEARQGFCRKLPVAICILSSISASLFYKKILGEIEKHLVLPTNKCKEYLKDLQKLGVPNAGASLSIPDNSESETGQTVISRPFDSHTVGMELTRSLQLLDVDVLLKAIASLLLERRVLMLSSNTLNLLHCCTAVSSLLYPFQWQHLLMPIVPSCLAVQCCIETPYLLGIVSNNHSDILDLLGEQQVFVVDTDKGSILKSFGDEDTILPKKVQKAVICALNLAKNMTDPTETMRDIMISEAIVHMFVELLGHCLNHFLFQNGCFIFQKEAFQKNSPSRSIQSFLEWFSETQMFDAFIEECVWRKTYRDICQSQLMTFFEKRVEEYKWELAYNNDRITRKIVRRVQDFGEKLKGFTKS